MLLINRQVCLISLHVFQILFFCVFVPKEEAISCLFKLNIKDIKVYFTLIKVKKILSTYKMCMKTLIHLISKIRCLILAVKGQNKRLIKHHYVFCNITNKQSAPSFPKTALSSL